MTEAEKPATPAATAAPASPAPTVRKGGRIIWVNVLTVVSAAILIGAEVFGAAFAAGWAFAMLFGLGEYGPIVLQTTFFAIGVYVMFRFLRNARTIEPFVSRE
jgi:hypothetical protein